MRQPANVPRAEKIAYVDSVIKMLEMEAFENALIGEVGEGLNVEARKRLTIGVELAAKPALLLFADEPTSGKICDLSQSRLSWYCTDTLVFPGLDSQSAWSIVQFLRKLADHGQVRTFCCTAQEDMKAADVTIDHLCVPIFALQAILCTIHQPSSELFQVFDRLLLLKVRESD